MGKEIADDIVFFSRSASVESPKDSLCYWTGDQMHTWDNLDGLESTVCTLIFRF
jgi:alpha-glucosidase (family GH31 glycosyl hydrolase)